jgi:hypothetical protein
MHLLEERGRSYFANSKRLGNNRVNEGGIADRGQGDEDHTVDKVRSEVLGKLKSEPCLTDATRTRQGEEACISTTQKGADMGAFLLTSNESSRWKGKVI